MDNPKCSGCGCRYSHHDEAKPRRCRTQKAKGWSEEARQFSRVEVCDCQGYQGVEPVRAATKARDTCPHECLEGSRVCVICKVPVPVKAKR